jgi:hypothetical protein
LESGYTISSGISDPVKVAVDDSGSYLEVANGRSDQVTIYGMSSDLPSSTPSATVSSTAISNPGALAFVPGTTTSLLASTGGNAVGEISSAGAFNAVPAADAQFVEPDAIGFSTDGSTAFVSDETGQIEAVSTSNFTITGSISGTTSGSYATSVPIAILCTSATVCLVANAGANTLGWFSPSSLAMAGESATTDIDGPAALAAQSGASNVYVVNDAGGTLGIWSTTSSQMTGTIPVGANPCSIAVTRG